MRGRNISRGNHCVSDSRTKARLLVTRGMASQDGAPNLTTPAHTRGGGCLPPRPHGDLLPHRCLAAPGHGVPLPPRRPSLGCPPLPTPAPSGRVPAGPRASKSEKSQPGSENALVEVIRFRTGPATEGRRRVPSFGDVIYTGQSARSKSTSGWGLEKAKRRRGMGCPRGMPAGGDSGRSGPLTGAPPRGRRDHGAANAEPQ